MSSPPAPPQLPHRVIPPGLPLAVLAVLFGFVGIITWLQSLPNPAYAERTGVVEVSVEGMPRGARALQLRTRCGPEVVDNLTLTSADFKMGAALRLLPLSDAGDCYVEARELPAQSQDYSGAAVGEGSCSVAGGSLAVSCS